jgi:hypothetical protein
MALCKEFEACGDVLVQFAAAVNRTSAAATFAL